MGRGECQMTDYAQVTSKFQCGRHFDQCRNRVSSRGRPARRLWALKTEANLVELIERAA